MSFVLPPPLQPLPGICNALGHLAATPETVTLAHIRSEWAAPNHGDILTMRRGQRVRHKPLSACGRICSDLSTQFTAASIRQWSTGTAWHVGHLRKGRGDRDGGRDTRKKEKTWPQQKLLHVLVDKYHRPILNPHQRHGSQHRSHRSLLVSDLLLRLDPPAMAYVPILQTTVRQSSVRFTLLLRTTVGFTKTRSNAHIMRLFLPCPSGSHPPDQLG